MRLCISIVLAGCLSAFNWGTTDEEKGLCIGSIEPSCYNKVQRYGICCIDRDNRKEYRNSCFACNDGCEVWRFKVDLEDQCFD